MPAAAAAPMQGTYIPQYTAVPASAITVEVSTERFCLLQPAYLCQVNEGLEGGLVLSIDLHTLRPWFMMAVLL